MKHIIETNRICVHQRDLEDGHEKMIAIAAMMQDALNVLHPQKRHCVRYINIVNLDTESPDYNPDGTIGHFLITAE